MPVIYKNNNSIDLQACYYGFSGSKCVTLRVSIKHLPGYGLQRLDLEQPSTLNWASWEEEWAFFILPSGPRCLPPLFCYAPFFPRTIKPWLMPLIGNSQRFLRLKEDSAGLGLVGSIGNYPVN